MILNTVVGEDPKSFSDLFIFVSKLNLFCGDKSIFLFFNSKKTLFHIDGTSLERVALNVQ